MNTAYRMFAMMAVMATVPFWETNLLPKVVFLLLMLLIALTQYFNPDSTEEP